MALPFNFRFSLIFLLLTAYRDTDILTKQRRLKDLLKQVKNIDSNI